MGQQLSMTEFSDTVRECIKLLMTSVNTECIYIHCPWIWSKCRVFDFVLVLLANKPNFGLKYECSNARFKNFGASIQYQHDLIEIHCQ